MPRTNVKSLKTLDDLGTEMRRIYRAVKDEKMDMPRGKGLVYLLSQIVAVTRESDLEQRIEKLEQS